MAPNSKSNREDPAEPNDPGVPPHQGAELSKSFDRVAHQMQNLDQRLEQLTSLLAVQTQSKQKRRRQFTLRFLLVAFACFALGFAWVGNIYHRSQRQAAAVDRLITESVFVMYSPRESPVVAMMPGTAAQPPASLVDWFGDDFFRAAINVSTSTSPSADKQKKPILESISKLTDLERLRLKGMQLRTSELKSFDDLSQLQSIDLSRTGLDAGAMNWLRDKDIRWFNASHTKISDRAMFDLSHCEGLQQLYLERTAVTDTGLKHLYSMSQLRYINLKRSPVSAAAVKKLSDALPGCVIDWEPLVFRSDGKIDGVAVRRGRKRHGRRMPDDPRLSRQAIPPFDASPNQVTAWPMYSSGQTYPANQSWIPVYPTPVTNNNVYTY